MKIILSKTKVRKALGRELSVSISKEQMQELPTYFYADVVFKNVKERRKGKHREDKLITK